MSPRQGPQRRRTVAAVAASMRQTAARAAAAIEVDYEPLTPVLSIDCCPGGGRADPARGPRDLRQVGGRQRRTATSCSKAPSPRGTSSAPSRRATRSSKARGRPRRSITSTWSRTAASPTSTLPAGSRVRDLPVGASRAAAVAQELGEPMAKIRRSRRASAAAFGGKHASNLHSIAAWLARAARRPVKLVLSRMQDFEIQRSRHPARIWMRTGARRDGTILARDVRITLDGGANADESPTVLAFALADVARPVPDPERARAGSGRLHEQAAGGIVPRLRQSAGELRGRVADRRPRREAWHRSGGVAPRATRCSRATRRLAANRCPHAYCANALSRVRDAQRDGAVVAPCAVAGGAASGSP